MANRPATRQYSLYIKEEVEDVTVLDHVFLTLGTHFPGFLGALLAAVSDEILEGNRLGADEAAFEIGVNHSGCRWRGIAPVNRPRPHFLDTCGEVGL